MPLISEEIFKVRLVDLGRVEKPDFCGILSPEPEIGAKREGIDAVFLDKAEDYYEKYQGFDYWKMLIGQACTKIDVTDATTIVEFGCGFGNSTLPLLDIFPRAHVIATDLSPNLLSILKRLLDARGLAHRCTPVAMDAHKDYIVDNYADLVVGSAILHHLVQPELLVQRAMQILKPRGAAIFFEPFEAGNALLRLISLTIAEEADRRKLSHPAIEWLRTIPSALEPQILRQETPDWGNRNDKWAFPKSVLERIARDTQAELITYPIHDNVGQFTRHFTYMLKTYGGMAKEELPQWCWDVFDRFDRRLFSPEMLLDLPLEGTIIFRKPLSSPTAEVLQERETPPKGSAYTSRISASRIYRRYLNSLDIVQVVGEAPEHPGGKTTMHRDTWVDFADLGPGVSYRKTFEFPGSRINKSHAAFDDAATGLFGVPGLIDIGIEGYLLTDDALKLYEMGYYADGNILELGTHKGLSTAILAGGIADCGGGAQIETVDIDAEASAVARRNVTAGAGAGRVTYTLMDATARLNQLLEEGQRFSFIFVDHWHGYQATYDAASRAGALLNLGGFILFHDFLGPDNTDPRSAYGVYQAVLDALAVDDRFMFYGNSGCSGLFRKIGDS
jgi:predicted O-methyltransferase YrrM